MMSHLELGLNSDEERVAEGGVLEGSEEEQEETYKEKLVENGTCQPELLKGKKITLHKRRKSSETQNKLTNSSNKRKRSSGVLKMEKEKQKSVTVNRKISETDSQKKRKSQNQRIESDKKDLSPDKKKNEIAKKKMLSNKFSSHDKTLVAKDLKTPQKRKVLRKESSGSPSRKKKSRPEGPTSKKVVEDKKENVKRKVKPNCNAKLNRSRELKHKSGKSTPAAVIPTRAPCPASKKPVSSSQKITPQRKGYPSAKETLDNTTPLKTKPPRGGRRASDIASGTEKTISALPPPPPGPDALFEALLDTRKHSSPKTGKQKGSKASLDSSAFDCVPVPPAPARLPGPGASGDCCPSSPDSVEDLLGDSEEDREAAGTREPPEARGTSGKSVSRRSGWQEEKGAEGRKEKSGGVDEQGVDGQEETKSPRRIITWP